MILEKIHLIDFNRSLVMAWADAFKGIGNLSSAACAHQMKEAFDSINERAKIPRLSDIIENHKRLCSASSV